MSEFNSKLQEKVNSSLRNYFGADNFDEYRFGHRPIIRKLQRGKNFLKRLIRYNSNPGFDVTRVKLIEQNGKDLQHLYKLIEDDSKHLLIDLIAYKLLGYQKVKLPLNTKNYWKTLKEVRKCKNTEDFINPNFLHLKLDRFNLRPLGYDIDIYFSDLGIAIDFVFEQYAYKNSGNIIVGAKHGDVVLDVGGCWGDTALYFASKVGESGKVFSFEFIPNNIKIFELNRKLNRQLENRIKLISNPVSNVSDVDIYYLDNGPGSYISNNPIIEGNSGKTTTLSIDDFVQRHSISKIDYIKMDIEGAEPQALIGAINTIKKFRPKLAIAIYHSISDFVSIPRWIDELNLGYKFYLGHYTIHEEETVLFAKPQRQ